MLLNRNLNYLFLTERIWSSHQILFIQCLINQWSFSLIPVLCCHKYHLTKYPHKYLLRMSLGYIPKSRGAIHQSMHVFVLSHFSRVQLFATRQTAARQAPLSEGFSRQEYWSGDAILQVIEYRHAYFLYYVKLYAGIATQVYCPQECMRNSVSPHPHQQLILSDFLILPNDEFKVVLLF